jgi:DNA-directed RNA polymerase subunit L
MKVVAFFMLQMDHDYTLINLLKSYLLNNQKL